MGRLAWVPFVAFALLAGSADRAAAISFSQTFAATGNANSTAYAPDRIEMYLPVGGVTTFAATAPTVSFPDPSDWAYTVTNGGYTAVLQRTSPFAPPPVVAVTQWTQFFEQSTLVQQTFDLTLNLVQLNWSTPDPNDALGQQWMTITVNAPGSGGPPGVVPEPSTLLILGLGGLAAVARMRRRRAALARA